MGLWAAILGVVLGLALVWWIQRIDQKRMDRVKSNREEVRERWHKEIREQAVRRQNESTGRRASDRPASDFHVVSGPISTYPPRAHNWAPYAEPHQKPNRGAQDDGFLASMAAAAATNNAAVGIAVGGNFLGSFLGEALAPDPEPCRSAPCTESYSSCESRSYEPSPSYDSGGSCDSSSSSSWSE